MPDAPREKAIPRSVSKILPRAPIIHFQWAPAIFPDRPWFQRNRLANCVRLRIGSLIIIHRASWLPHSARSLHPHLFTPIKDTPDAS